MTAHPFISITCTGCGLETAVPVYCGDRFCPICSVRRQARIRHRLKWLVEEAKASSSIEFRHITLSIRSQQALKPMIRRLLDGFKKLRSKSVWRKNVKGGAYVVEITNSPAGWHAHLHIVVQSCFIGWTTLRDAWRNITGATGCYITRIPALAVVRYLTKYLTKPSVHDSDVPAVSESLAKVRMFNPFGTWHSLNRRYIPPVCVCPNCKREGTYMPSWIMYGGPCKFTDDPGAVSLRNAAARASPSLDGSRVAGAAAADNLDRSPIPDVFPF